MVWLVLGRSRLCPVSPGEVVIGAEHAHSQPSNRCRHPQQQSLTAPARCSPKPKAQRGPGSPADLQAQSAHSAELPWPLNCAWDSLDGPRGCCSPGPAHLPPWYSPCSRGACWSGHVLQFAMGLAARECLRPLFLWATSPEGCWSRHLSHVGVIFSMFLVTSLGHWLVIRRSSESRILWAGSMWMCSTLLWMYLRVIGTHRRRR